MEHGLTSEAIRHELKRGAWQQVTTGVYATFSGKLTRQHQVRAAILHAGPEAVVTGGYACAAYGMQYTRIEAKPVILVPHEVKRAPIDIATIRRTRHMPASRVLTEFRARYQSGRLWTRHEARPICETLEQLFVRWCSARSPP